MFKFEADKTYQIPLFFGSHPFGEGRVNNFLAFIFTMTTDGKRLAEYLPEGFKLRKPELNIQWMQLRECEWMNGGGYNLIQVDIPASFNGQRDHIDGAFPLIIWENNATPIISGREQSGQPKVFADIQDMHVIQGKYFTHASYDNEIFLRIETKDLQSVDKQQLDQLKTAQNNSINFGWRYIPKLGGPGADFSQPMVFPTSLKINNAWTGKGNVEWVKGEQNEYNSIIKQLGDLPIYSMAPVSAMQGSLVMKAFEAHEIK